jgi:hypothetical protein
MTTITKTMTVNGRSVTTTITAPTPQAALDIWQTMHVKAPEMLANFDAAHAGIESAALERYRLARAQLAEQELSQKKAGN